MFWRSRRARFANGPLIPREKLANIRVFASTVIRGSDSPEMTGLLVELDWQNSSVKKRIPIPLEGGGLFWNARGGNRGGRGVFVHGGTLYLATALCILKFDRELNQTGQISHPYLAGLHEIYVDDEGVWVTSTIHDLVMKIDFDGNVIDEWCGSESEPLQRALGYSGRKLNLALDFPEENFVAEYEQYCDEERLHVNTVWPHNGALYALACRKNAFVKIRPLPEEVVLRDNRLGSPHNGIVGADGRIMINDTENQAIRLYSLPSGKPLRTLSTPAYPQRSGSEQFAKAGWQRGLAHLAGSVYLAGTSPATVFEVDIDRGVIGQMCRIDADVRHCIHGLAVARDL